MSPTHQDLSNDTTLSQIKSRVPVPLDVPKKNVHAQYRAYIYSLYFDLIYFGWTLSLRELVYILWTKMYNFEYTGMQLCIFFQNYYWKPMSQRSLLFLGFFWYLHQRGPREKVCWKKVEEKKLMSLKREWSAKSKVLE